MRSTHGVIFRSHLLSVRIFERSLSNMTPDELVPSRGLTFLRPALQNKLYLEDIERFLRIIRTEKWLGQSGVESLQKMALALLETIESKNTLLGTLSRTNKTFGGRLQCLVRCTMGEVDQEEEQQQQQQQQDKSKQVENCLTTPPEIGYEQPNHRTDEPLFTIVNNVNLQRDRKC